jgi:hypothetical protein
VIPEIDNSRAAQSRLKRDRGRALEESTARADEFAAAEEQNGAATWRRIANAVVQLANTTPARPGALICFQYYPKEGHAPRARAIPRNALIDRRMRPALRKLPKDDNDISTGRTAFCGGTSGRRAS